MSTPNTTKPDRSTRRKAVTQLLLGILSALVKSRLVASAVTALFVGFVITNWRTIGFTPAMAIASVPIVFGVNYLLGTVARIDRTLSHLAASPQATLVIAPHHCGASQPTARTAD